MQFLRRQRNGRKRKSYLERIGFDDKIKSATEFYKQYSILNRLQTGGQGTIYSIKSLKFDEKKQDEDMEVEGNETNDFNNTLVVKIISFTDIDDDSIPNELKKALTQYLLIYNKSLLNHYGIYYDEHKKQLLIVTEKLKMNLAELKNYIYNNELNEETLKYIMTDILNNLYILHENGYTHNDITPFNLMCNYNNEWKLIDFDMILKIDTHRGYTKDCWKGTIGWVSKEIGCDINSSQNKYTYSSDLWAFGLVLLYILNGFKNPFELSENEIIENGLNNENDKLIYYYKYKMVEKEYENKLQYLLITWFASDKISYELYDLLLNYLLVFNVCDRTQSCQHIICHPWFKNYILKNKYKYKFLLKQFQMEIEGETQKQ